MKRKPAKPAKKQKKQVFVQPEVIRKLPATPMLHEATIEELIRELLRRPREQWLSAGLGDLITIDTAEPVKRKVRRSPLVQTVLGLR